MFYTGNNFIYIDHEMTRSLVKRIDDFDLIETESKRNRITSAKKPKTKAERKALRRKQEQVNQRNKLLGKY